LNKTAFTPPPNRSGNGQTPEPLSEATHVQITDIDATRLQLRVSHPKGGRQRVTILSPVLLQELRQWYRVHRPVRWLFSQGPDQDPICKGTAQSSPGTSWIIPTSTAWSPVAD